MAAVSCFLHLGRAVQQMNNPVGASVDLDGMVGLDSHGNAGLRDQVDRRYRRLFDVKADGWLMVDEAISEEIRGTDKSVEPKPTESMAAVWIPESLRKDIDEWVSGMGPNALLFPSETATPILPHNYLSRVLKPAAEKAGLTGVNHRVFRRTCGTLMQAMRALKDVQAHLRHSSPDVTLRHYVKPIDESVKNAVEGLRQMLRRAVQ
jgi:hypothetical protein